MGKSVRQGDSTRAVGLLRVSTSRQELSPHAQATAIQQWADANGVELVAMFFDKGVSGSSPVEKRPALTAALGSLRALDVGSIVVAKRDRLARDVMIAATVERIAAESGAVVVSAAGEGNGAAPADRFMRQVLDAVAELERATIRARTAAALAAKKSKGESKPRKARCTPPVAPYGFRLGQGGLVPVPEEQAVLEAARALRATGLSLAGVSEALAAQGKFNRLGKPFARDKVWNMVRTDDSAAIAA